MTKNSIVGIGLLVLIFAIGVAAFFAFPGTPLVDTMPRGGVVARDVSVPREEIVVSAATTTMDDFPRNTEWNWIQTVVPGGRVVMPRAGASFRISFDAANRFDIKGDCNSIAGRYVVWGPGDMSMENIMSTEMYCENSQESDFMNTLSRVTAYKIEGDTLTFDIEGDIAGYGAMTFARVNTQMYR